MEISEKFLLLLADKAQIKISQDELDFFIETFVNIKKGVEIFLNTNFGKKDKKNNFQITDDFLSLKDLKICNSKIIRKKISKRNLKKNAIIRSNKIIFYNDN